MKNRLVKIHVLNQTIVLIQRISYGDRLPIMLQPMSKAEVRFLADVQDGNRVVASKNQLFLSNLFFKLFDIQTPGAKVYGG